MTIIAPSGNIFSHIILSPSRGRNWRSTYLRVFKSALPGVRVAAVEAEERSGVGDGDGM